MMHDMLHKKTRTTKISTTFLINQQNFLHHTHSSTCMYDDGPQNCSVYIKFIVIYVTITYV